AERLTRVSPQAERATKIVATLLALSRKRPPRRRPVNVTELLVGTLDLAGYDLKHARVVVERDFAEALPAVLADPDQLQQVFANLLLNAAQAMGGASGSGILAVSAGRDPEGSGVQIAIRDNGPGIDPEHLPHIFEPFFRTKGEGQGTGLGLAICQRIIENHGGRITVASQPGAETVFTVTLPVVSVSDGAGAPRGTADAPGDAMDVLLVEDEPLVGEMLAEILTLAGYQVDRAANGREALTQLATHAYALIVSDVRM